MAVVSRFTALFPAGSFEPNHSNNVHLYWRSWNWMSSSKCVKSLVGREWLIIGNTWILVFYGGNSCKMCELCKKSDSKCDYLNCLFFINSDSLRKRIFSLVWQDQIQIISPAWRRGQNFMERLVLLSATIVCINWKSAEDWMTVQALLHTYVP